MMKKSGTLASRKVDKAVVVKNTEVKGITKNDFCKKNFLIKVDSKATIKLMKSVTLNKFTCEVTH